jgi:hypothetical protein
MLKPALFLSFAAPATTNPEDSFTTHTFAFIRVGHPTLSLTGHNKNPNNPNPADRVSISPPARISTGRQSAAPCRNRDLVLSPCRVVLEEGDEYLDRPGESRPHCQS